MLLIRRPSWGQKSNFLMICIQFSRLAIKQLTSVSFRRMPYFRVPLVDNRFVIQAVVLDLRSLSFEEAREHIQKESFEGNSRSVVRALLDTGATHCTVTEELVQRLSMKEDGECPTPISTAGHPIRCKQYSILLGIPLMEVYGTQKVYNAETGCEAVVPQRVNHFKAHVAQVIGLPKQGKDRGFDVIIGMDFLGKMMFHYSGNPATAGGEMVLGF